VVQISRHNRSTNLQLPICQNGFQSIRCNPTLSISISKWSSEGIYLYIIISRCLQQPFVTNQMRDLCFTEIRHFLFNRLIGPPSNPSLPPVKITVKQHRPLSEFRVRSITRCEMFRFGSIQ